MNSGWDLDIGDGEFDQSPHPGDWRQAADIKLTLFAADVQIGVLEDREPERLLVAEVVVEHPLADASPRGDLVHSGAGEALGSKFRRCRRQDSAAGRVRLATAQSGREPIGA